MFALSTEERLALLLNVLGNEASAAAFKSMHPTRAKYVEQLLSEYQADPPSQDEIEYVVQDFNKYFAFAMETLSPQIEKAQQTKLNSQSQSEEVEDSGPKIRYFEPVTPTDDVIADLNQLDPYQVATALAEDHPKTVALVLRKLKTRLTADVIKNLPESNRADSVVYLSQDSTVPGRIEYQVLESTFAKANSITFCKEEVDQAQVMAELMRSLPKEMRNELIERLNDVDEELVENIRSKLYIFEDLLRLDDRGIQKVLGEIETDILIVALQKADPNLVQRLLDNLSKRARQTILEEMEYKSGVSQEEIDEARKKLVEAVGRLDESGEISLT